MRKHVKIKSKYSQNATFESMVFPSSIACVIRSNDSCKVHILTNQALNLYYAVKNINTTLIVIDNYEIYLLIKRGAIIRFGLDSFYIHDIPLLAEKNSKVTLATFIMVHAINAVNKILIHEKFMRTINCTYESNQLSFNITGALFFLCRVTRAIDK